MAKSADLFTAEQIAEFKRKRKAPISEPWWCKKESEHTWEKWSSPTGIDPSGKHIWTMTCSKCGKEKTQTDGYSAAYNSIYETYKPRQFNELVDEPV